jgi:hypothetical protein
LASFKVNLENLRKKMEREGKTVDGAELGAGDLEGRPQSAVESESVLLTKITIKLQSFVSCSCSCSGGECSCEESEDEVVEPPKKSKKEATGEKT